MKQPNWTRLLTILLVILAIYGVLYVTGTVLGRFRHVIVIFVLGALAAYVLSPLVKRLEVAFRVRWIAILASYALLATGLLTLGVFLFTPFIQQSQSLIENLHTPSSASLQTIIRVQCLAGHVENDLQNRGGASICGGSVFAAPTVIRAGADIGRLQRAIADLKTGTISGPSKSHHETVRVVPGRQPPNPGPQTKVPPSYVLPIQKSTDRAAAAYANYTSPNSFDPQGSLKLAVRDARKAKTLAKQMYTAMSKTPILLIRSQTWLDQHGIGINVQSRFGDAASQLSNQGTLILDNAVTILQETANTLLNLALILIIAFYLLSDGGRLVRATVHLAPQRYEEQIWFFVQSLDRVLGGYIRGQIFLSGLAGVLGGAGAAALGVPYPLLIGILTFLLESIPIIGPLVALFPAIAVSLFFEPILTTILLLIWNIVFQQIVTNVLGPRINGMAVGIHPLEAMGAVLVGYPLAGFLGALLAVPVMGVLHLVIRESYAYLVLGKKFPTPDGIQTGGDSEEAATESDTGPPIIKGRGKSRAAS
ncbi:MAG: AI-2E family transporter [Chloroflexota bacterium]